MTMTHDEIVKHVGYLRAMVTTSRENPTMASPACVHINSYDKAADIIDQLLAEREWQPLDDKAKYGQEWRFGRWAETHLGWEWIETTGVYNRDGLLVDYKGVLQEALYGTAPYTHYAPLPALPLPQPPSNEETSA